MLNSSVVNAAVLCALISSGSNPACVIPERSGQPQVQQRTTPNAAFAQTYVPKAHLPFQAPGRLGVVTPSRSLSLAEENEVFLRVHARGLTEIETEQVQYAPNDVRSRKMPQFPRGGWAMLPVTYHADGNVSIKVTPRVLGQLVLRIVGRFPDGGVTKSEVVLNVRPPERFPDRLVVGDWVAPSSNARFVNVFMNPKGVNFGLTVGAVYENVTEQVEISPSFASFEVRTANDTPIIALDKSTNQPGGSSRYASERRWWKPVSEGGQSLPAWWWKITLIPTSATYLTADPCSFRGKE